MPQVKTRRRSLAPFEKRSFSALKIQLQDVLAGTTEEMLRPLLDLLGEIGFEIGATPSTGLLMMNIRESDGTVFHLGEVLVTQAEVNRNGHTGFGCCMGDRPDTALALACLDALGRCDTPSSPQDRIIEEVDRIYRLVSLQRNTASRMSALSRVDFHSMAEE